MLLLAFTAAAQARELVLGRVSDDPRQHYEQLRPLLDYVVPRMADVGIREGRVLMARDSRQMESYLRRGRVDWVTETSGSAMALPATIRHASRIATSASSVRPSDLCRA